MVGFLFFERIKTVIEKMLGRYPTRTISIFNLGLEFRDGIDEMYTAFRASATCLAEIQEICAAVTI